VTLTSLIPDVDVFVALAPEELAEVVLRLAAEHRQNNVSVQPLHLAAR
jgi:hypothetical protein